MEWPDGIDRAYTLIVEKLTTWLEQGIKLLPNAIVSLFILLVFWRLGLVLRGALRRALAPAKVPEALVALVTQTVYFAVFAFGVFVALSVLELDGAVTSLLAGVGIVGLALSFAFQDLATNFISGLILIVQQPLRVGDLVHTGDFDGIVLGVGLRSVTLRDLDGQHVVIPTKDVFQNALVNFSMEDQRRVTLSCGVSYGEDLPRVERLTIDAVRSLQEVVSTRPVTLHWTSFGGSSIDYALRFWTHRSDETSYNDAHSAALKAIKAAYDQHDIVIPFPIRTVDFGIKGGKSYQDVLTAVGD
ncbi:MAG: mechanosensitive ion channel family protein [Myxococcota bacterium]